jgi:hypothetical protein
MQHPPFAAPFLSKLRFFGARRAIFAVSKLAARNPPGSQLFFKKSLSSKIFL